MSEFIEFEVSGLEDGSTNALKHYEVEFSRPVNADWLIHTISAALKAAIEEPERQIPEQAALNLAIVAMMRAWRGQRYLGEAQRLACLQLCICDIVRGERNSDVEWWDDRITARRQA